MGSFDSLNPLIVKGAPAANLRHYVFESLMARNRNEPFSLYPRLAKSIDTPDDRSQVTFVLDERARFADGQQVTTEDVLFSWRTLRDRGRPNHRYYYGKVEKAFATDKYTVTFKFKPDGDREMPLIMGLMPVLPKHHYGNGVFEKASLDLPLGSGPYVVSGIKPGASITYRRNPEYWGRDLPAMRGRFNFDEVRIDYYRDDNSRFEAFKKGLYDVRSESDTTRWASGYDFPAVKDGRIVKETFAIGTPAGMSALVFNTRRPFFADIRVRKALIRLFDFEWINAKLYFGLYTRTQSYFDRSELSSHGHPASKTEKELLAPFPGVVDADIMAGRYSLPKNDGSGRNRKNVRTALKLLAAAGYKIRNGVLVNAASGKPFEFEIMVSSKEQERLALNYASSLKRAGIIVRVRQVDSAQYQRRKQRFDFDMMQYFWYSSLSPGNERSFYWGSKAADTEGSRNYMGVREPAIDAMIKALVSARERPDFVAAVRALDRVLLSGRYVIPLFYLPKQWVARWTRVAHPVTTSLDGYKVDSWWAVKP
jgi:peptide/nickel transport system substrate-binding protein